MLRIMTIFGTRPEAIKMAPVIAELRKHPKQIASITCVTAQHREMLDQVLVVFGIEPDYDLGSMRPGQTLSALTEQILSDLKSVLEDAKPNLVLVQGDTTTTFVASLAAYYQQISVGHIEAGLRTNNKYSPFPEEVNRRLTSVLADLHFAPTERAKENLSREGIGDDRIAVTGNTAIDALLSVVKKAPPENAPEYEGIDFSKRIVLVTAHRRESFGEPFAGICRALRAIADGNEDIQVVYPVHLNPHIQGPANELLSNHGRIKLLEPMNYRPFVGLMNRAYLILTDSGGIQEEAPSLGKPILVMRDLTERPEAIESGTARIVGTAEDNIISATELLLKSEKEYKKMANASNPYGDGTAASRIVQRILEDENNILSHFP